MTKMEFITTFIMARARGCEHAGPIGIDLVLKDAEWAWENLWNICAEDKTK